MNYLEEIMVARLFKRTTAARTGWKIVPNLFDKISEAFNFGLSFGDFERKLGTVGNNTIETCMQLHNVCRKVDQMGKILPALT